MDIFPAVDIQNGQAVRLRQGDFARATVFDDSPAAAARRWAEAGASWVHMVDLDGARTGKAANANLIREAAARIDVPIQLGGGIRDLAAVVAALDLGVQRVVIGTAALRDPEFFQTVCREFPGRIVAGIDARDGLVATHGWAETSGIAATTAAADLSLPGVAAIVFTDIARDGMMQGPNLESLEAVITAASAPVIASGGISTLEDVRAVAALGVTGAIIGRALYDGSIDLADALNLTAGLES
jgi:phosphoribosylformimino-5-aminoimidazole carboxamide ribotide isomerase